MTRVPLKPKSWTFFTDALEEGCAFGLTRAVKYEEDPAVLAWVEAKRDFIIQTFMNELLNAIDSRFDWEPIDLPKKG